MTKPLAHYSPVFRTGEWLICSGQLGVRDGALVEGGVSDQTRQALHNLRTLLEGEGASLTDVVKATVFLADIADFAAMNDVYAEVFGDHKPARSAFAVGALPLSALVEIEAWAHQPAARG